MNILIELIPKLILFSDSKLQKRASNKRKQSRRGDLNPRPADYESAAIPLSHDGKCTERMSRLNT